MKTITTVSEMTKDYIIRHAVAVEAGYVNDPDDSGGETNHGITIATATEYKADLIAKFNWDGKMINLTEEMAMYIYDKGWWQKLALDDIIAVHPFLADRMFDFGINAGRSLAASSLQRIINTFNRNQSDYKNIAVDGAISKGGATVRALQEAIKRSPDAVLLIVNDMIFLQGNHYINCCERNEKNEKFKVGWDRRVMEAIKTYYRILLK